MRTDRISERSKNQERKSENRSVYMRVFVTGATGFVGSALVPELIDAGHQVLGLARNDAGAQSLAAAGAQVHRGDVENLESLRTGAVNADAVIHTAFIHDFSKFQESCEIDRKAIETLGDALAGSDRLFIVTSGLALVAKGRAATEQDLPVPVSASYPRASEEAAAALEARGVRTIVMRLSQIHDTVKQGLVTYAIQIARQKGVSAYIGDGLNRFAAAPRLDTARLYQMALEKGDSGARYHAVAEEGVPMREIAEAIGQGLHVPVVSIAPEKAAEHFGWFARFAGLDISASSAQTRKKLGWNPKGPGLIADLENMRYE
jgi:nucleoside-diphosphate-sugar epimerase